MDSVASLELIISSARKVLHPPLPTILGYDFQQQDNSLWAHSSLCSHRSMPPSLRIKPDLQIRIKGPHIKALGDIPRLRGQNEEFIIAETSKIIK